VEAALRMPENGLVGNIEASKTNGERIPFHRLKNSLVGNSDIQEGFGESTSQNAIKWTNWKP
jgi:hypothetical protein